jgi:hypothetical protein
MKDSFQKGSSHMFTIFLVILAMTIGGIVYGYKYFSVAKFEGDLESLVMGSRATLSEVQCSQVAATQFLKCRFTADSQDIAKITQYLRLDQYKEDIDNPNVLSSAGGKMIIMNPTKDPCGYSSKIKKGASVFIGYFSPPKSGIHEASYTQADLVIEQNSQQACMVLHIKNS